MLGVVGVALLWGWSYVLTKVVLAGASPVFVAWGRVALGAAILLPVLRLRGLGLPRAPRAWGHLAVLALTLAVLPFGLTAWAQQQVSSALASVLMAAVPVFTAPFAALLLAERLRARQWAGLALGVGGVAVLAGLGGHDVTTSTLGGVAALTVAAASYGFGYTYIKRHLPTLAPLQVAGASQLLAAVVLLPPALGSTAAGLHLGPLQLACLAGLGVFCTGAAQLLNYRNIDRLGPTVASLATYLIPVVGITAGVLTLGDPITARLPIGAAIILLSVAIVHARPRRTAQVVSRPAPDRRVVSRPAAAEISEEPSSLVVWKFGGTSVADHDRLRAVAQRLVTAQRQGQRVVAVLSAMGNSTDELSELAHRMSALPPKRELDALLSVGESISCALAAMAVHELGGRAVSLTGAQAGIRTDAQHGTARVDAINPHRIHQVLDDGAIVLVTGFQGISESGDVTTLGRGGSDASAVALAAALGVPECDIFTDVAGVFTADPRVVPDARRLPWLHHDQMLEMAQAGAAVLQPHAVKLAAVHGIDIHLRSSFTTQDGTWIRKDTAGALGYDEVAGIAHRRHESLYCVRGISAATASSGLGQRGAEFLGVIVREGDELRFTAPGLTTAEVTAALGALGAEVTVHDDLGTVSVVGVGDRKPTIAARARSALEAAGITPHLVTTTPGRVCAHISTTLVDRAVGLLHTIFLPHTDNAGVMVAAASSTAATRAAYRVQVGHQR